MPFMSGMQGGQGGMLSLGNMASLMIRGGNRWVNSESNGITGKYGTNDGRYAGIYENDCCHNDLIIDENGMSKKGSWHHWRVGTDLTTVTEDPIEVQVDLEETAKIKLALLLFGVYWHPTGLL
ncbi:hypothetical protein Ddc_15968 [Ditylenchus destructor]|nr:hypothetical protein Ddc_15968 [Ditylenchus destructor]